MTVHKLRCPECDASIRKTIDDDADEIEITCPRCSHEFKSTMESEAESKNGMKAKKRSEEEEEKIPRAKGKKNKDDDEEPRAKKNKRKNEGDDDDEDDDKQPRKKKKKQKEQAASKTPLIIGGVVVLLLAIGGIVTAISLSGKPRDVAKADSPAPQTNGGVSTVPGPGSSGPGSGSTTGQGTASPTTGTPSRPRTTTDSSGTSGIGTPTRPGPANPSTGPNAGPNTVPTPGTSTGPISSPSTGPSSPPKKNSGDLPPGVPPPPKLRLHAPESSIAGTMESSEKARPTPPLSPDDDPFVRAKSFISEGAPPALPKLPPPNQRPVLALDSGGHSAFIRNVFITPVGDRVITIGEDKAVRFWDIKTGTVLNTIRLPAGPGDEGALQAAALSSKGKLAVSGTPVKSAKQGTNTVPIFILNADTGHPQNRHHG
jgi:hypothetical protein